MGLPTRVTSSPTRTSSHGPASIPIDSPVPAGKFREFFRRLASSESAADNAVRQNSGIRLVPSDPDLSGIQNATNPSPVNLSNQPPEAFASPRTASVNPTTNRAKTEGRIASLRTRDDIRRSPTTTIASTEVDPIWNSYVDGFGRKLLPGVGGTFPERDGLEIGGRGARRIGKGSAHRSAILV